MVGKPGKEKSGGNFEGIRFSDEIRKGRRGLLFAHQETELT
jgi:hypothetical protein